MDGLLLISYFNALRARGLPLREAIVQGASKRVRPVMMTALTALLGLLPAALSTRIGAQTQKPLAIVVVGGICSDDKPAETMSASSFSHGKAECLKRKTSN
jgi:heavy metal efflux system protein